MTEPAVAPFRVAVTERDLDDLRTRLAATRWPEPETVDGWSQGVPLRWLRDLCRYWREEYDWRRCEQRLNALPQFTAALDGLDLHFVHVRSPRSDALPVLLTHGWPGGVVEFLDVVGPLADPGAYGADPADAFHVVCPSLPGYGFSGKPTNPGWGVERTADAWDGLMRGLGYDRYAAQGGDWGSIVTTSLAQRHPESLAGIHLNFVVAWPRPGASEELDDVERRALADWAEHVEWGRGYSMQQATRPQTLGYGLTDSPAGQCAWIVEKFWAWTDHDGDPTSALDRDRMLDVVSLYWLTRTAVSSARLYWETGRLRQPDGSQQKWLEPIAVPAAISVFPREISRPSRRWCEPRFADLRFYEHGSRGGHFAAYEQPEVFVDHLRRALRPMRN